MSPEERTVRRAVLGRADDVRHFGRLVIIGVALIGLAIVGRSFFDRDAVSFFWAAGIFVGGIGAVFLARALLAPHRQGGSLALHVVNHRAAALAVVRKRTVVDLAVFLEASLDDVMVRRTLAKLVPSEAALRDDLARSPAAPLVGGTYRAIDDDKPATLKAEPALLQLMRKAHRLADPRIPFVPLGIVVAATRGKTEIAALVARHGVTYARLRDALEGPIGADYPLHPWREDPTGVPIVVENDDVTTQAFVRDSFVEILRLTPKLAHERMQRIHVDGRAEAARFQEPVARHCALRLVTRAREAGFPLRVLLRDEPVEPTKRAP